MKAVLEDGRPVRIDTADGWRPVLYPGVERGKSQIRMWAGDSGQMEALIRSEQARLARDGRQATPGEVSSSPIQRPRVNIRFAPDGSIWLRKAAKVALAVASLVLPDS